MFPTTRRSLVEALASPSGDERARAFDTLFALYWKPVYKYLRVGGRRAREDAEDLTQAFFTRAFEKDTLASYDPRRASFRSFLRTLLDRHASNESKAMRRQKRGGGNAHVDFEAAEAEIGREPAASSSPEDYFHREWVRSVFALSVDRLRESCVRRDRALHFALFEAYDLDESSRASYADLGERFGIRETAVTNHLASVRREFREIVLKALREATASDAEFRSEARSLLGILK